MMDAIGKKYAVHEIVFDPRENCDAKFLQSGKSECVGNSFMLTATFRFVPLWFFENHDGKLKFLANEGAYSGMPLEDGAWMVTVGDGLMEACSIAYIFKHLPLRDWLVYCERNGMPGVKGTTDALPNTEQWEAARDAVEDFGAEFNALMSKGTDIEAIDLSTRGELPYPKLIDRMDRAISALWRGSDLTTLSRDSGAGASLQADEAELLEEDDAGLITETLNSQVDKFVIKYLFGDVPVKAYFRLVPKIRHDVDTELKLYSELHRIGIPLSISDMRERFGVPSPSSVDDVISKERVCDGKELNFGCAEERK
jgi:phage gp29-like protein